MSRPPVLLIGGTGQVGRALARRLTRLWPVVAPPRAVLDLADRDAIRRAVRDVAPFLIVNAAAFTAVDEAERDPETAMAVNGAAPGVLAEEAKRRGIPLVHYSTDYVFGVPAGSGEFKLRRPFREDDPPSPVNVYGRTKLTGEQAVAAAGAAHLMLRLSWVYARQGRNFVNTIRSLAERESRIAVVDDQTGGPTWAEAIADVTVRLLLDCWRGGCVALEPVAGLYHLAATGEASRFELAREIADALGSPVEIVPVSSRDRPTPAARPAWSVLDTTKLRQRFGIDLPPWRGQLRACLAAWQAEAAGFSPFDAVPQPARRSAR